MEQNTNTAAIIKLVAWIIIAALLIGVLVFGLNGSLGRAFSGFKWFGRNTGNGFGTGTGVSYSDSKDYTAGPGEVSGSGIDDIEINWVNGSVTVEGYDGDTIRFTEDYSKTDEYQMRYLVKNGKLTIQPCADMSWVTGLFDRMPVKHLTVQVPAITLKDFDLESVSADLKVTGINTAKLKLDNVSGTVELNEIQAKEASIDTVSGNITGREMDVQELDTDSVSGAVRLSGSFQKADMDTTSGEIELTSKTAMLEVDTDSVSGEVTLNIPRSSGFVIEDMDSASGDLDNGLQYEKGNSQYSCGDGSGKFNFGSVSGDVRIRPID